MFHIPTVKHIAFALEQVKDARDGWDPAHSDGIAKLTDALDAARHHLRCALMRAATLAE